VESKKSQGGTSSAQISAQLESISHEMQQMSLWIEEKKKQLSQAEHNLFQTSNSSLIS
jgi:hypothetical protein